MIIEIPKQRNVTILLQFAIVDKSSYHAARINVSRNAFLNSRSGEKNIFFDVHSPLSHGGHIGYDVCSLGKKLRRCVSNLRFAAINHAKQRSFQCALMCPCA